MTNNHNKEALSSGIKILIIITIVMTVASAIYTLLAAMINQHTQQEQIPLQNNKSEPSQRTYIPAEKVENDSIQQDLGLEFNLTIKERVTIGHWFIFVVEPASHLTDPALLIYKKEGDGNLMRVIGPGTLFSRQQLTHKGIPGEVIDNHVVKGFIGGRP